MFTATAFRSILPEILILSLGMILLVVEPFWGQNRRRYLGGLTAGGLLLAMAATLLWGLPGEPTSTFGTTIRFDHLAVFFKLIFVLGAAATSVMLMDHEPAGRRGEAYLLLLASTIGMCLMASAGDLVMLYLAIEATSIPLYVLAGFTLADDRSTEAGFKYLLYGAMTSAVMLYGFSLLYGFGGTTDLYALSIALQSPDLPRVAIIAVMLMIVVGLGFKVSIVPLHFWAPDVYEGAPTPVAGFLSTASKGAGFAVLARLFLIAFPATGTGIFVEWTTVLAVLSAVTMTVGNLLALPQRNLKRLLAYSSIAHAGYVLIGVVAASRLGVASVLYYMLAYLVTNLAAFGVVMAVGWVAGSDEYDSYRGLSRRSPALALAMLVAFLSLAGMPPFGGFIAKVLVFAAGMQSGYAWLVAIGIINSVIGVYYYLNVMKLVYLYRMEGHDEDQHPVKLPRAFAVTLAILTTGIILVGTVFTPWFGYAATAAGQLF
ncbi:MAG TPA: NADH-quinone oxidoreductase subunit N [Anaerolineales bacterium]|nr:NADH-quinone oxidoreductase subunit N [Anaerolineales bacterium]